MSYSFRKHLHYLIEPFPHHWPWYITVFNESKQTIQEWGGEGSPDSEIKQTSHIYKKTKFKKTQAGLCPKYESSKSDGEGKAVQPITQRRLSNLLSCLKVMQETPGLQFLWVSIHVGVLLHDSDALGVCLLLQESLPLLC